MDKKPVLTIEYSSDKVARDCLNAMWDYTIGPQPIRPFVMRISKGYLYKHGNDNMMHTYHSYINMRERRLECRKVGNKGK